MNDITKQILDDVAHQRATSAYEANALQLLADMKRTLITDARCAAWLTDQHGRADAALDWIKSTKKDIDAMFKLLAIHVALERAEQRELKGDQSQKDLIQDSERTERNHTTTHGNNKNTPRTFGVLMVWPLCRASSACWV